MIAALMLMAAVATTPIRCGAVERPGVAEQGEDGVWRGAAVDLCRQMAASRRPMSFHLYATAADLAAAGRDDLAVLSAEEIAVAGTGPVPRGGALAVSRQVLLVAPGSAIRRPEALAGRRVCVIVASPAEAALNRWARDRGVAIYPVGFQEAVELRDGFDAGYCAAMAVDAADVPGGGARTRAIAPDLAQVPLYAVRRN